MLPTARRDAESAECRVRSETVCGLATNRASLLAGLMLCVAGSGTFAQSPFARSTNGRFYVGDQPLRFVGFSLRGICHYGESEPFSDSSPSDRITNLDFVQSVGGTVIRAFVAYRSIDRVETGDRLQIVLDAAWSRGIRVICVLTDFYPPTSMHPMGDDIYYGTYGGWDVLLHTFFAGGYRVNYLPQAVYLANRFRNHPGVFAWELTNEGRDLQSGATFASFCLDVIAQIRAADPNHMIGLGLISSGHANLTWEQMLQVYPNLDYLTSHNYNGSDAEDERGMAAAFNKPFFVEEAGFEDGDRPARTDADIRKWLDRRASGYVQWGLMATPYDMGDGDWVFGMDQALHPWDWAAYVSVYAHWGWAVAPNRPWIARVPSSLAVTGMKGFDAAGQTFTVANDGGGTLNYTVTSDASWLDVTPATGTSVGETDPLDVRFHTANLAPGDYSATITISDPNAGNNPQTILVNLAVNRRSADFDSDGDVDLTDFSLFQVCFAGPNRPPGLKCPVNADFDSDGDVDLIDFARFQACFNGPNRPSACLGT